MLGLLIRGARDLPERQRSLRAAIDWSVQLPRRGSADSLRRSRRIQRRSDARCGRGGRRRRPRRAHGARRLLDAALVPRSRSRPASRASRCWRRCASTRRSCSQRPARRRRAEPPRRLVPSQAEGEGVYWRRNTDAAWLERVEMDHDNYRAALAHARTICDAERELRLANALRYFWRVRGYIEEGRRRLEEAVGLSDGVEPRSAGADARRSGRDGIRRRRLRAGARALERGASALGAVRRAEGDRALVRRARRVRRSRGRHARRRAAVRGVARLAQRDRRRSRDRRDACQPRGCLRGPRRDREGARGVPRGARAPGADRRRRRRRDLEPQHGEPRGVPW